MFYFRAIAVWLSVLLLVTGCQTHEARIVMPDKTLTDIDWTIDEVSQPIAIRHLDRNTDTSTHVIRLAGNEFPHYHDYHDLIVHVLSGESAIHFQHHSVKLNAGDVLFIPRGSYHWAENLHPEASIVYAVFSPGFDGKDRRRAD